jgi:antitoxin VapB
MNKAKIFKNGDSQAVRLPKEYRFHGKEVYIRKDGNNIILSPVDDIVDSLWMSLQKFDSDINLERNQPTEYDQRAEI